VKLVLLPSTQPEVGRRLLVSTPPAGAPNSQFRRPRLGWNFAPIGLLVLVACGRIALWLESHVPMGHDSLQYLQLQYQIFTELAQNGEIPLWFPHMTQGTVSNIWLVIAQGLLGSVFDLMAPFMSQINYLFLYQAGLLFDEALLLCGVWMLAGHLYRHPAASVFVTASLVGAAVSATQIWWNFHLVYLLPLILACGTRAALNGSRVYLFCAGMFTTATLLANLPYFLPITLFSLLIVAALGAALYPAAALRVAMRWRTQLDWRTAFAIGIPAMLGVVILAFDLYGTSGEVVYANVGRSASGDVPSVEEFVSYGGYISVWKYLTLIGRYTNNLDNTLYAGALIVPFAATALAASRQRLSVLFGVACLIVVLFGSASVVTLAFFYGMPFGRYFRHIGLAAPVAMLFLVLYAGFGFEVWARAVLDRAGARNLSYSIATQARVWSTPCLVALGCLIFITFERMGLLRIIDFSAWVSIPTRNQIVLSPSDVKRGLDAALFVWLAATVMLTLPLWLKPVHRWLPLAALLTLHVTDLASWRWELESRQAPAVSSEVSQLFDPWKPPFVVERGQAYFDSPRFRALAPYLFESRQLGPPDRPFPTVGAYGALYWNLESFVGVDALASIFRSDHWLRSSDEFYQAWAPPQRLSDRHLGLPLPSTLAYYRVAGATNPKVQLFSHVHVLSDEGAIARIFTDSAFSGEILLTSNDAVPESLASNVAIKAGVSSDVSADERLSQGLIEVTDFSANRVTMNVHVPGQLPAILYYADSWHPFWHARVDGRDQPVLRANLGYKAVTVPGGDSLVQFEFGAPVQISLAWAVVLTGAFAAMLGAVLCFVALRGGGYRT